MSTQPSSLRWLLVAALAFTFHASAAAQPLQPRSLVAETPLDPETVAAIRAARRTFAINLPDGSRLPIVVERSEKSNRALTLIGQVRDQPGSSVVISSVGKAIAGTVRAKGPYVYVLATGFRGVPVVRANDPQKLPPDDPERPIPIGKPGNPPPRPRGADTCTTDDPTAIQMMVLYSTQSKTALGGVDATEATIYAALAELNQANANSDVTPRYELVHLAEVAYTATNDSVLDVMRLRDAGDGFVDDVHAKRDLYRADVVGMMVESFDYCGMSYGAVYDGELDVVRDPGNVHEAGAFVTFNSECVQTNLTFAHEFGHLSSARHGWAADPSDNRPTHSNHGHVAGTTFRTLMATTYDSGNPRVPNFSNPDILRSGLPTGTFAEPEPTDNHSVLNMTAPIIANYRCSIPRATNVWMKDTWGDTGAEPDADPDVMYASPYIWARRAQDTPVPGAPDRFEHEHQHENPVIHQQTWVYVKIHNNGGSSASGNLKLYYANASSSLTWPGGFTLVGDIPIAGFAAGSTKVVEFSWNDPPGSGHYCMIARWESAADPMAFPETSNIDANTRNNNNIVWRNMDIAGLGGDAFFTRFEARSIHGRGFWLRFSALGEKPFLPAGHVEFSVNVGGKRIKGQSDNGILELPELEYQVRASGSQIFFAFPKELSTVQLEFRRTPNIEKRHYRFLIQQFEYDAKGSFVHVGGMVYDIDATSSAPNSK